MEVGCIKRLRSQITVKVQHSLRKENTKANYFANLVFCFVGEFQFNHFQEVPSKGRKIINLVKLGVPHIRRTTTTNNFDRIT